MTTRGNGCLTNTVDDDGIALSGVRVSDIPQNVVDGHVVRVCGAQAAIISLLFLWFFFTVHGRQAPWSVAAWLPPCHPARWGNTARASVKSCPSQVSKDKTSRQQIFTSSCVSVPVASSSRPPEVWLSWLQPPPFSDASAPAQPRWEVSSSWLESRGLPTGKPEEIRAVQHVFKVFIVLSTVTGGEGNRVLPQLCVAELAPLLLLSGTRPAAPPTDARSSSGHQRWGPYCNLSPRSSTCGLKDETRGELNVSRLEGGNQKLKWDVYMAEWRTLAIRTGGDLFLLCLLSEGGDVFIIHPLTIMWRTQDLLQFDILYRALFWWQKLVHTKLQDLA